MPESTSTENSTTTDGSKTGETTSTPENEFKPITSQDDLNKIIGERIKREQGKFADYSDLKAKAAEYDKLADANKSEIEKANERVSKAEAEVAQLPAKVAGSLREHLIELHQIDQEKADLFLTAADPELLLRQTNALLGTESDRKKHNNYVPTEGTTTKPKATGAADMFAAAFEGRL